MLKTAIIGVGKMGKLHAKTVQNHPGFELIGFKDINPEAISEALELFPKAKEFKTWDEINAECDAVIIATPASSHEACFSHVIMEDINILCEKPLFTNLFYYGLARKYFHQQNFTRTIHVGHSERYNPVVTELKKQLEYDDQKSFGVKFTRWSKTGRNNDVNCIWDTMIHDIDLLYYLFPEAGLPEKIECSTVSFGVDEQIKSANVTCFFKNGIRASFHTDKNHSGTPTRKLFFEGNKKIISCNLANGEITQGVNFRTKKCVSEKDALTIQLDRIISDSKGFEKDCCHAEEYENTMRLATMIEKACVNKIKRLC